MVNNYENFIYININMSIIYYDRVINRHKILRVLSEEKRLIKVFQKALRIFSSILKEVLWWVIIR